MTVEGTHRRRFLGKVFGTTIGVAGGFAASFPIVEQTRGLRGAEFPKLENLANAKVERQNHQLILEFVDFEKSVKKRRPRLREKEFSDFLEAEKEMSGAELQSAKECFKKLFEKKIDEKELRLILESKLTSFEESIKALEQEKKQHLESQDLAAGDWSISVILTGLFASLGWFIGSKIDTNLEVSDEKKAEQAMIDSRK